MRALNHSRPLRSIFSHIAGVRRTVRCTRCSSGGFGGRPRGRFGSSMQRTVAPIYEDSNNPCIGYFSDYNKSIATHQLEQRMTNSSTFQVGQRVQCNGQRGVIVKVCDGKLTGMYEIRLPRGVVCVDDSYLRAL